LFVKEFPGGKKLKNQCFARQEEDNLSTGKPKQPGNSTCTEKYQKTPTFKQETPRLKLRGFFNDA